MAGGAHRAEGRAGRGLLIFGLVLVVVAVATFGVYRFAGGASGPSRPVAIDIPTGATASQVGDILQEAEVVRSSLAFRIAAVFGAPIEDIFHPDGEGG